MRSTIEQSLQNIRQTADAVEATARYPASAPIFAGHFPGKPIVPAVYQIALCRAVVEMYQQTPFVRVVRSRFSAECVPGVTYDVKASLEEEADGLVAQCSIKRGNVIHSKIVLFYGKAASPG